MNSIEVYIQFEPGLITDDGQVTNDSTADFLRNYMREFYAFIERVYTAIPRTS
jgi:chromate reductase